MEIRKNSSGIDTVVIKTANGKLMIYESDPSYPGVYIDYILDGMDGPGIPIAHIEDIPKGSETPESIPDVVTVRVWSDPWNEDYTNRVNIPIKDFKEALEHDKD